MQKILSKLGFSDTKTAIGFFSVATAGQVIYSSFEAFKGTFYDLLLKVLGLTNAQLGIIFSLIGISVFLYIPAGWVNNRFSTKSILVTGLLIRFLTINYIVIFNPAFAGLKVIATIWGIVDAFFWPAVLNGVVIMTKGKNQSVGFGLLESLRRAQEVIMNLLVVGTMALISGIVVFKGFMLFYNLLIIPLVFLIIKYVPKNGISTEEASETNKSADALKGLIHVALKPQVWLAAMAAMAVYWSYIILIYTVPYLHAVFGLSSGQTALFGIFNTGIMGIIGGITAGILAEKLFKSSSLMMAVSLFLSAVCLGVTLILPHNKSAVFVSIAVLFLFSFFIFLSKGIILAPVAEVQINEKYSGSAMSIGSFLAYAPVFWAYSMNGTIIDKHVNNPLEAYRIIFLIGVVVALFGAVCALVMSFLKKKTAIQ